MVSVMMIFVGTEYAGGPQFHVWVEKTGTTEDLIEAISKHQNLGSNDFILQHTSMPLLPYISLNSQRINAHSTVHMFRLCDLKAQDQARKLAAKKEAEERGRYITKDGTDRLRRRTRQALAMMKAKKEKERLGGGLVPCYAELDRVAREYQGDEGLGTRPEPNTVRDREKSLEMSRRRRGEKLLLTTAPLDSQSSMKEEPPSDGRPARTTTGLPRARRGTSSRQAAPASSSPSSSSRASSSSVAKWAKTLPPPILPQVIGRTIFEHGSEHAYTPEAGTSTPPASATSHSVLPHKGRNHRHLDRLLMESDEAWYVRPRREITPPLPQFQATFPIPSRNRPYADPYPSPTPSRMGKGRNLSLGVAFGADLSQGAGEATTKRSVRTVGGRNEQRGGRVPWLGR
ncbi:hypothetical protein IAU59_000616 [Kwoniella sp. CBS 9459]